MTLDVPTAILAGEGDMLAHVPRHAARLVAEVEGSTLRVLPNLGHLFHYDAPEQVVAAIDDVAQRRRV